MRVPIKQLKNVEIISIEGNIGSGKSTLLEYLLKSEEITKQNNNVKFFLINEPVDLWNDIKDENGTTILEKFYKSPSKYAFSFQMMAYVTRFERIYDTYISVCSEAEKNQDTKYIIFTERCLYTDKHVFAKMLYQANNMESIEYSIYNKWFNAFINWIPINKILYVKANPILCYKRVGLRDRDGEDKITLEYLEMCDKYHRDMMNEMSNIDIFILDGNENIHEEKTWYIWKNKILQFVNI